MFFWNLAALSLIFHPVSTERLQKKLAFTLDFAIY